MAGAATVLPGQSAQQDFAQHRELAAQAVQPTAE